MRIIRRLRNKDTLRVILRFHEAMHAYIRHNLRSRHNTYVELLFKLMKRLYCTCQQRKDMAAELLRSFSKTYIFIIVHLHTGQLVFVSAAMSTLAGGNPADRLKSISRMAGTRLALRPEL